MCEHINDDDDGGGGGVHQLGTKNKLFNYKLDCLDGLDEILKNFTNKKKQWQEQHVLLQNNNNNISAGTLKLNNNNNNNTLQQQQAFDENKVTDISSNNQPILFEIATTSSVTSSSPEKSSSSVTLSSSCSSSLSPSSPSTTDLSTHILPAVVDHQQQQQMSHIGRDGNLITCMLITANVGTIFEESTLLELWFEQLKSYLVKIKPQLVAIHCQEVGGKNFETSMKNVSGFTDKILGDSAIIGDYSRVKIFLDENYDCLEKFTALGSLYLVHDSVDNVKLYNFKTAQYDVIEPGRDIFAVSDKKDLMITKTSTTKTTTTTTTTTEAISETATTTETSIKNNIKQASESNNCSNNNVQEQQQPNEEILGQEREQKQYCHRLKNAKLTQHVEKIKFPIELFPECRWSRKGFMRTRWLFNDCQPLDLVNIHLFHDASNLVAMKTTPSPYAQNRQKALEFALQKLAEPLAHKSLSCVDNNNETSAILRGNVSHTVHKMIPESESLTSETTSSLYTNQQVDHEQQVPLFIFGDFNFRLDTNKVIQRITEGISPIVKKNAASNEVVEFVYHRKISNCSASSAVVPSPPAPIDMDNVQLLSVSGVASEVNNLDEQQEEEQEESPLMTVGKKLFDYRDLDETFRATKNTEWLLEMDNELDSFRSQLYEFKISFSPSYPFKEDETGGYSYMKTRCPAWCDRILFNAAGYKIISSGYDIDESKGETTSEKAANVQNILDSEKIELLHDHSDVIYRLMGNSVPMGDHKPVLLYCQLNISPQQQQQQQLQQQQQQQQQQLEPKLQLNPSSIKCNQSESMTNQQQVVTSATSVTGAIEES